MNFLIKMPNFSFSLSERQNIEIKFLDFEGTKIGSRYIALAILDYIADKNGGYCG